MRALTHNVYASAGLVQCFSFVILPLLNVTGTTRSADYTYLAISSFPWFTIFGSTDAVLAGAVGLADGRGRCVVCG